MIRGQVQTMYWKKYYLVTTRILQEYSYIYTKRLNPEKSAKKNKYGMEMIDCSRGTNRVEAYHKNLNVTFGGGHVGVTMSAVLFGRKSTPA